SYDRYDGEADEEDELAEHPGVPPDHGQFDANSFSCVPVGEGRDREHEACDPGDLVAVQPESLGCSPDGSRWQGWIRLHGVAEEVGCFHRVKYGDRTGQRRLTPGEGADA